MNKKNQTPSKLTLKIENEQLLQNYLITQTPTSYKI